MNKIWDIRISYINAAVTCCTLGKIERKIRPENMLLLASSLVKYRSRININVT